MSDTAQKSYSLKVKKLPSSRVEMAVVLQSEEFDKARAEALRHIGAEVELPGFRKGKVPEKMLAERVGEAAILEEMAEIAIGKTYMHILEDEHIDAIGRPEVKITKIAPGNPLEFTLTTDVFPVFEMPDHKKIAAKAGAAKEAVTVTDDEVAKMVDEVRQAHAPKIAESPDAAQDETKNDVPLPELTDEFVRTLGDFKDVAEFTNKVRENILAQKRRAADEKRRIAIIEAIIAASAIELPETIVAQELLRIEDEFAHDIGRMGLTLDKYLEAVKKTKEDLHKEMRPDAEKRAKTQLLVARIADAEGLRPKDEELGAETAAIRMRFPDAPEDRARDLAAYLLTNKKVFEFLESLS